MPHVDTTVLRTSPLVTPPLTKLHRAALDMTVVPVCSWHGCQEAGRRDWDLQWRPDLSWKPGWWMLSRVRVNTRVPQNLAQAVLVRVTGWPLCEECLRFHHRWRRVSRVMAYLGLLLFVGSFGMRYVVGQQLWLFGPLGVGVVLLGAAVIPFTRGSLRRITGAVGTPDGSAVLVHDAHPDFVAAAGRRG